MSRYFFNVHDGQDYPDVDGTELPSVEAARSYAVRYAGELLQHNPEAFWSGDAWRMDVTDERGLILFELMFIGTDAAALKKRP